ncbi:MAG: hypothetical protein HGA45_04750 [Chloroflexales bacterium]|nr:hypothetical protein [Chloroflexales bacterium]
MRTRNAELEAALAAAITARLETERSRADERVQHEAEVLAYADAFSRVNAEMARVLQVKDAFLTMISHELCTPLTVILGSSAGLIEEIYGPLSPQQRQPLKRIDAAARRLLAILNDILRRAEAPLLNGVGYGDRASPSARLWSLHRHAGDHRLRRDQQDSQDPSAGHERACYSSL